MCHLWWGAVFLWISRWCQSVLNIEVSTFWIEMCHDYSHLGDGTSTVKFDSIGGGDMCHIIISSSLSLQKR